MSLQFRVRGSTIQVIRPVTDPETNRPRRKVLGRISPNGRHVPADLTEKLEGSEPEALNAYVNVLQDVQNTRGKLAALSMQFTVADAVQYLDSLEDPTARATVLAAFRQARDALTGAMRRAELASGEADEADDE